MSDFFAAEPAGAPGGDRPGGRPPGPAPRGPRRPRPLLLTVIVVGVLIIGFSLFAGIWTDKLWFSSLGYSDVFSKLLVDPRPAVRAVRRPDGPDRRGEPLPGLPAAPDVPPALTGTGQPGALPRGDHTDAAAAAARRQRGLRDLRRQSPPPGSGASSCCGTTARTSARPTPISTRTSASTSSACRGCTSWSTS